MEDQAKAFIERLNALDGDRDVTMFELGNVTETGFTYTFDGFIECEVVKVAGEGWEDRVDGHLVRTAADLDEMARLITAELANHDTEVQH